MDRNARRRKRYVEMPDIEKADLSRHRRGSNATKRRNASISSSNETIKFQSSRQNSRNYFSRTLFGYVQIGVC